MSRRGATAAGLRNVAVVAATLLASACAPAPADAALQACSAVVIQKSGTPIHIERNAMLIGALDPGTHTLQVSGPLRFEAPDGSAHIETLDCRVRIAGGSADVIHLQLSWSQQELERTLRETR